jgi:two-component system OmpR family response regulator
MAKRILIADDHGPTRTLIRTILEGERTEVFEIVEATCGGEAITAFEKHGPFDLVLLDVTMPDMDGYTACRHIRDKNPDVPIVFVTAKGDLKDYTSGREAGGDSYIVKPIARASLRSIVSLFTSIDRRKLPAATITPR